MQIEKVCIKNFKGIEEKEIIFKPGFNLIKGINGTGKTSILEAIAVGLGGFVAGLPDVTTRHFSADEEGHEVFYDKQEEQLMYKVGDNILPIGQLSAGYQSLVWMAFDIAYRMAVLNPYKQVKIIRTS